MTYNPRNKLKSEGERRLAAALDYYSLPFIYEPKVTFLDGTRDRVFRPDFFLPDWNVYIEYFGRVGDDSYDKRTAEKIRLYESNRYALAAIYPWDLCTNWPHRLLDQINHASHYAAGNRPAYGNRPSTCYGGGTHGYKGSGLRSR